jgi:hypothetical protein
MKQREQKLMLIWLALVLGTAALFLLKSSLHSK